VTTPLLTPDLRGGDWTRRGGDHVRGDASTELLLGELAERTRAAARSQGFSVGWAEGCRAATTAAAEVERRAATARADADTVRREEHRTALTALRLAAVRLDAATAAACAAVEAQASELALALTEELVGHALLTDGDADVVRRAVQMLPQGERARVRLHPSVASSLPAGELTDLGVTVVADSSIARDDALVELDDRLVSVDVGAALQRLREVLS